MAIRVLVADDHKILQEGLRALLRGEPEIEVIGGADNGRAAVKLARELRPDVVIMDVAMPDLNGIDATRQIVAQTPGVKVLALSAHADRRFVAGMLRAGAAGYLLKDTALEELALAIKTVAAHEVYLSPQIAGLLVRDYLDRLDEPKGAETVRLTPREREVLQLLAEGKSTKEIAGELEVSGKTVETHRKQIMDKLSLHSVAELTKFAIREGLTSLDP